MVNKIKHFSLLIFVHLFLTIEMNGQKIGAWHMGLTYQGTPPNQIDTGVFNYSGLNILSFNPLSVQRKFKTLSMNTNVTNMWD